MFHAAALSATMDHALVVAINPVATAPDYTGAWIMLGLVFLCGMLFQACVPRLCQYGRKLGGKCLNHTRKCGSLLKLVVSEASNGIVKRRRSEREPLADGT